jgi:hypothetical protein
MLPFRWIQPELNSTVIAKARPPNDKLRLASFFIYCQDGTFTVVSELFWEIRNPKLAGRQGMASSKYMEECSLPSKPTRFGYFLEGYHWIDQ